MTDFSKLMVLVGVLSLVTGVFAILGNSLVPGGFFVLSGLAALGGIMANQMGLVEQLSGDFDKLVGTLGFGVAVGIGLAWFGMAAVAFNSASVGGAEGHPDLRLWWGVIGTFLSIAGIGVVGGGLVHFRQQRD